MQIDSYGHVGYTEKELIAVLRKNSKAQLNNCALVNSALYNSAISTNYSDLPPMVDWNELDRSITVEEFHKKNTNNWLMPAEYAELDIAKWLLMQCNGDAELQRMGEELLLFADRELLPFLCYLKYMVDTFKKNKVLLGVGRGSSVASFALYKLGVHRINSLQYGLNIAEFLKNEPL
jgi:DNA polymerase III alpha subunit